MGSLPLTPPGNLDTTCSQQTLVITLRIDCFQLKVRWKLLSAQLNGFLTTFLLKYASHIIQFIYSKYIIKCYLVYSQGGKTITSLILEHFSSLLKKSHAH